MRNINTLKLTGIKKALGLIGSKIKPVFFQTRFGIHTFFVKYPIDALILDQNFKVVRFKTNLKPNRIFIWNPRFYNVVELPEGYITKNKIKIGSKIQIKYL